MQEVASAFQTRRQQSKWDKAIDPACGAEDTRWHQVFDCPAYADIRGDFQDTVDYFRARDTNIQELPVIHVPRDVAFQEQMFFSHPAISFDSGAVGRLNALALQLASAGLHLQMFTDGSCLAQDCPTTRYAAYSVVADLSTSDHERCDLAKAFKCTSTLPSSFLPLAAARVTGEQCIHRAEKFAVPSVVENFNFVTIHIDSQVALNMALRAQGVASCNDLEADDDFDLARPFWFALQNKQIVFKKVKAHEDGLHTDDLLTVYRQLGNKVANGLAITACRCHLPTLATQHHKTHLQLQEEKAQQMLLPFSDKRLQLEKTTNRAEQMTNPVSTVPARLNYAEMFGQCEIALQWQPAEIRVTKWEDSTWGRSLLTHLQWPDGEHSGDSYGVTWLELATSFFLFTNSFLPLRRARQDGTEVLALVLSKADLDIYAVKFSEQV